MSILRFVVVGVVMLFAVACGSKGDDDNGRGGRSDYDGLTFGKVKLTSSKLAGSSLQEASAVDCAFNLDIYRGEGACLSPLELVGYSAALNAADTKQTDPSKGSARIAGVAGSADAEGSLLNGAEFNFKDSKSFTAYNELFFQYEQRSLYTHLAAELAYEKVKFKIKDKYVTLIISAMDQPFQDSEGLSGCNLSADEKQQPRYSAANVLTGMSFKRGDYLFCVKDSIGDACAATDFRWLDKDSGQLVSTRPTNPRSNPWLKNDPITCVKEGDRPSINIPFLIVAATLTSKFQLWADFSHGVNSKQYPEANGALGEEPDPEHLVDENFEEPYLIYTYKAEGGAETPGTNLDMTFDFDVTDAVFVENLGADDIAGATLETVLAKVYMKHDWVFEKKSAEGIIGYSLDHMQSINATPTIRVTGGTERPTLVP